MVLRTIASLLLVPIAFIQPSVQGTHQTVRGRRIAGITVAVRDLAAAAAVAGTGARRTASSVFVDPGLAAGYRLEFRRESAR